LKISYGGIKIYGRIKQRDIKRKGKRQGLRGLKKEKLGEEIKIKVASLQKKE